MDHSISEEVGISLHDIWQIILKKKKEIFICGLLTSLSLLFFTLSQPVQYSFEATFKEKETQEESGSSLLNIMQIDSGKDSNAVSMFKSRTLMEKVIQELNLQGRLIKKGEGKKLWGRIWDNLLVEYAHLKKRTNPLFADPQPAVCCKDLTYTDEVALVLNIHFISPEAFEVYGREEKNKMTEGKLNFPCILSSNCKFTLTPGPKQESLENQWYTFVLSPMAALAKELANQFDIDNDEDNASVLHIKYQYPDRKLGAAIVNTAMKTYQGFLKNESDTKANIQLAYLEKRELEMAHALEKQMHEYAYRCSQGITSSGFIDNEKRMEFLSRSQQECQQKLMQIDLELKRLSHLQEEDLAFYDRYSLIGDAEIINPLLAQIRTLKQKRASIGLNLGEATSESQTSQHFTYQIDTLNAIQRSTQEIQKLIQALKNNEELDGSTEIYQSPYLLVDLWDKQLRQKEEEWLIASENEKEVKKYSWDTYKENFNLYLNNILRDLHLREILVQEQLAYRHDPLHEFQGIDNVTAEHLYLTYQKHLDETQAQIRQNNFIVEQIPNPNFEISSLSDILTDSVSRDIIKQASLLRLALQDNENRTEREQERIKADMLVQKEFLLSHLKQSTQIAELREQLFKEKIRALQFVYLDLTNQQISILEKQFSDYLETRMENLDHQRDVIKQHMAELQKEMAELPIKWTAEKLFNQQLAAHEKMMEGVSHLVESKIVSHNLELILSSPIDQALPPILPTSPKVLKMGFLGSFLGVFLGSVFSFLYFLIQGIPATPFNLISQGFSVAGILSNRSHQRTSEALSDNDLETLRHIILHSHGKIWLLASSKGPDYSHHLASLLAKQGKKILILPFSFDHVGSAEEQPGLLQHLQQGIQLNINKTENYEKVVAGGISRYTSELLQSERFKETLAHLRYRYDHILAVTAASPFEAEVESFFNLVDYASLTLTHESISKILAYQKKVGKPLTFIFTSLRSNESLIQKFISTSRRRQAVTESVKRNIFSH